MRAYGERTVISRKWRRFCRLSGVPTAKTFCCRANRSCRRRKRFAAEQIVHADGENVLPSSKSFMPTAKTFCCRASRLCRRRKRSAPSKSFMPTAKTFCRRANRSCRRRKRFAVEQIVHADSENVLPSSKSFMPTAKTFCCRANRFRRQGE